LNTETVRLGALPSKTTLPHGAVDAAVKVRAQGRLPELDGIRAIAILAVLANHFFSNERTQPAAGALHGAGAAVYQVAAHGWLGVDLFFVLSGFLITGILLDTRARVTYFHDFWLRRALRILPLVFTVVVILTVFYRPPWLYVFMAFFFTVDIARLFGLGDRGMGPLWSLAVEEQFYLVWPFLVLFLRRRALVITTLVIIIAEPIARVIVNGPLDLPWFRVDGLAMGALIAIFVRSRYFVRPVALRACGVAVVVALAVLAIDLQMPTVSYGLRITEADLVFGAAILAALAVPGTRWLAPLRSRTARFIADTSFCAYLIHVPLLDLARFLGFGSGLANLFLAAALQAAVALPLTFGIAALSRRYLEVPFLRLKDRFAPSGIVNQPVAAA
jgi:peptidoglycan/LPS O-acetylase OafA/YrhL